MRPLPFLHGVRLTYDATTDVAYLALRSAGPKTSVGPTLLVEPDRDFPGVVALDFSDGDGRVIGLEFLDASRCLPAELLAAAERVDGTHAGRMMALRLGGRATDSTERLQ